MKKNIPFLALIVVGTWCGVAQAGEKSGFDAFRQGFNPPTGKKFFLGEDKGGISGPKKLSGLVARNVIQVTNETLPHFLSATKQGYLEVVIPAGKGHVFFRYGGEHGETFDFSPKGLTIGDARPIKSERYGVLIPLTPEQEGNLKNYLDRLKDPKKAKNELGEYDFYGANGYHCVTWMTKEKLDQELGNLLQILGGKASDGYSMPALAEFLVKRAKPVAESLVKRAKPVDLIVYSDKPMSSKELSRKHFDIITLEELFKAARMQ
jgi:hypothetical protein